MKTIELSGEQKAGFQKVLKSVEIFCKRNPCVVGGAEIVTGAGLVALAVKLGAVDMGAHLVGLDAGRFNVESFLGAGGGGLAGSAASILGSIGVVAGGGAIGIPAALLGVAGAAVGAFTGYGVGDVVHNLLAHAPSYLSIIGVGSLLVVGLALIIDGCRRILGSETFQKAWSSFKNGIIYLTDVTVKIVSKTADEISEFLSALMAQVWEYFFGKKQKRLTYSPQFLLPPPSQAN